MRAGRLRHKITIERQSATEDAHGERIDTWATLAIRWASVEPLNGKEFFASSGEQSQITTRIRLRYDSTLSDLAPPDRISFNSVIYNIESVINPNELNKDLILMCKRDG